MKNKPKRTWIWISVMLAAVLMVPAGVASAQDDKDEGFEDAGKDAAAPGQKPAAGKSETVEVEELTEEGEVEEKPGDQPPPPKSLFSKNWFRPVMIGGFVLLYIFMGRGKRKREAKRKEMLSSMKKGDRVITIGGIVGTIIETREDEIVVKVDDNTRLKFSRWAIRNSGDEVQTEKKQDTQPQQ